MLPSLPYTTYLIDLDGVIYRGNELLPGAQEFIAWLDANHKKYLFLTNNSFASETQVLEKLTRLGIASDTSHVLGAGQAAVQNIAHRFPAATVYLVGEEPMRNMLLAHHLRVAALDDARADVVLVGLDRTFDYKKLTNAVQAIMAGAAFIAVNRDPRLPVVGGLIPGCGAMVAAIEAASGITPEVVGKPEPTLLLEAMRLLASTPEETVMIGDTLSVDILAGKNAATHTIFVLSGSNSLADEEKYQVKPDHIYQDVAALLKEVES
ncbi:MAG TPA: HAD-IIA family hydrolase [Ktedonobacteraceae bacterium]|nr:HAD-IIA family hydrolase [Ktedonobacteraceae bacterium]